MKGDLGDLICNNYNNKSMTTCLLWPAHYAQALVVWAVQERKATDFYSDISNLCDCSCCAVH